MKYTPEELQKLSTRQINRLVAKYFRPNCSVKNVYRNEDRVRVNGINVYDFVNCPDDIMPIAFEQGIQIKVFTVVDKKPGKWWADNHLAGDRYNYMINKNPLRAICEVFILMNQGVES